MKKIEDGTSKTIMLLESTGFGAYFMKKREQVDEKEWLKYSDHEYSRAWVKHTNWPFPFNHRRDSGPRLDPSGLIVNQTNIGGFYSFHDGASASFCDGHVQFFSEDASPELLVTLFTRAEGDVISQQ